MMVDSIFLYPIDGNLDVASIERFLAQQPDVLPDPLGTGTYLVCGTPEAKEVFRDQRLANPSEFPYVILVTVKPERINIYQEWGDEDNLRSARDIVRWVIEHNRCRIQDDCYRDWTERVAQQGVGVLYPEQLT
jgi:hypothetical protein